MTLWPKACPRLYSATHRRRTLMDRHHVIAHIPNTIRHNQVMDPRRTPMRRHPVIDTHGTVRRLPATSHRRTAMAHPQATVRHRAWTELLRRSLLGSRPATALIPNTTCRRNTVYRRALTSPRRRLRVQAPLAHTACDAERLGVQR